MSCIKNQLPDCLLFVLVSEEGDITPVCLFDFIINPYSFGQTIENLFHLSFLVRVSYILF